MDIILLDYIDKVGDKHDVVKVRDGFGRNYLIPKGLAIVANKTNLARLEGLKKQEAKKELAKLDTYRAFASKLAGVTIQIASKAGESGRLFGSVTAQHLADAIREDLDVPVEKRMIEMPEEVKELGEYEATVKFHPEVIVPIKFVVVRDKKLTTGGSTTTGGTDPVADRQPEAAPVEAVAVAAPVVVETVEEEVEMAVTEAEEAPVAEAPVVEMDMPDAEPEVEAVAEESEPEAIAEVSAEDTAATDEAADEQDKAE